MRSHGNRSFVAAMVALFVSPLYAAEIIVTNTSGAIGGPGCSLRDAITAANNDEASGECPSGDGADIVRLTPFAEYELDQVDNATLEGRLGSQVFVPNGLPVIVSAIEVVGDGSVIRRTEGSPAFRLLWVGPDGSARFQGVSFIGGRTPDDRDEPSGNGGAIRNSGRLAVVQGQIRDNMTGLSNDRGGSGGAIFNEGTLTLTGVGVFNNATGDGDPGSGGAIWNAGSLTIEGSVVYLNKTGGGFGGGDGGGVYNQGDLVLIESAISQNRTGYGGGSSGGSGAGIFNRGTMKVVRCSISENIAGGSDDGQAGGGAGLWSSGDAVVVNSTVSGNAAGYGSA